jgi:glycosyltransferase involved in cell wall biosynthesis
MTPVISVILPCRNEERFIGPCLDSFLDTQWPKDRLELLVVDGQSNDRTGDIVRHYTKKYPWIRLIENPKRIVPTALNLGIKAATGDIVVRMDAHVVYPPEYLTKLVTALETSGADNVGPMVRTLPANNTAMAAAIATALSHPFGVGNSYFRIGAPEARWVDTVPFGCWKREVFNRIGLFDEDLVRNQDEELNYRLIRQGGRVRLCPDVVAYYYARESPRLAARMLYQYGYFKPLVARKIGRIVTLRQLAPPAFVLALGIGVLLSMAWPPARLGLTALVLTYLAAAVAAAAGTIRSRGLECAAALVVVFPILHVSYGFGFLRGLWSLLVGRRSRWRDPATVPLTR